jgi:hypothetical protein
MSTEVSNTRLYLIRALFLVNFVLLGADVWPTILNHSGAWDPVRAAAFSFWGALSLLSALGLRYPLAMLPLLLLQLLYKAIWLLAIALPQWSEFQSVGLTQAMLVGLVLDLIVIPWSFVLNNYIRKPGDRWK